MLIGVGSPRAVMVIGGYSTEVFPAGGRKPAGCVIEIVVMPTAIGSNAVLRASSFPVNTSGLIAP
jgi:hypothetical protein